MKRLKEKGCKIYATLMLITPPKKKALMAILIQVKV